MKKTSKGKDPRNIKLPIYSNLENVNEKPLMTHAASLDSFWDGESIDEDKKP